MAEKGKPQTLLIPCAGSVLKPCKSEYQDKAYGRGLRVHNAAFGKGGAKPGRYRCTVCETEKTV